MPTNESLTFGAEPIRRRSLVMFIVVDVSGSMEGSKIGSVNTSLEELMPELANVGEADAEIKVAILTFSDMCHWLTPMPVSPDTIELKPLVADGLTNLGEACLELHKRMSRSDMMQSPGSSYAPIIILMSDGEPTDNYKTGLDELKKNKWFSTASKWAIPIGSVVDQEALIAFTGLKEAVLKPATRPSDLIKKIKMVALESSTFATRSQTGDTAKTRQEMIVDNIKAGEQYGDDDDWMDASATGSDDPSGAMGAAATIDPDDEW